MSLARSASRPRRSASRPRPSHRRLHRFAAVLRRGALVAAAGLAPLAWASGLAAQSASAAGASTAAGAATITAEDLRRDVSVLAADSMRGRDTPSPGLDATARYVAGRFRDAGLRPGVGESYQQRYPLTIIRPPVTDSQSLELRRGGEVVRLEPGTEFVPLGAGSVGVTRGAVRAIRGLETREDAGGELLLLEAPAANLSEFLGSIRGTIEATGASGALMAVELSDDRFAQIVDYLGRTRMQVGEPAPLESPVALVRLSALPEGIRGSMAAARDSTGWSASIRARAELEAAQAMNTIGWIEGSDPELRDEYVIFTAHMDHVGVGEPVDGDSIYNGADDDASGTATVLELAEAFGRAPEKPRRSMIFMTVSGEEKGLLGSRWYVEHPVFPLERTVAAINMDMIGRNWRDTVVAIGGDHSTLGRVLDRVAAARPALGMTVIEDRWPDQRFFFRSDHYSFARRGVPALFFFSGIHEDYHRPSDEADLIRYGKTARIGRLMYHLGRTVADADDSPRWDPESYRRIVEGAGSGESGDSRR